jgi:hypothetical protein
VVDARSTPRVDIELVTLASLDTSDAPRPQFSSPPTLTGVLYEVTATGREPVAGADLWAELPGAIDVYVAHSRSDRDGDFFLCKLPQDSKVLVSKDGYLDQWVGPIGDAQSLALQVELKRS